MNKMDPNIGEGARRAGGSANSHSEQLECNEALLTFKDVARLLGVSVNTLYFWVAQQSIPHVRLGARTVRFDSKAIHAWMASRTVVGGNGSAVPNARGAR